MLKRRHPSGSSYPTPSSTTNNHRLGSVRCPHPPEKERSFTTSTIMTVERTKAPTSRRRKVVVVALSTVATAALISLLLLPLPAGPAAVFVEGFTATATATTGTDLVTVTQPPSSSHFSNQIYNRSYNQHHQQQKQKQQQQQRRRRRRRFVILQSSSSSSPTSTIETDNEQERPEDQSGLSSSSDSDSSSSKFIVSTGMTQESESSLLLRPFLQTVREGKTLAGNYVIEMMMESSSSSTSISKSSFSSKAASVEEGVWTLYPLSTNDDRQNDSDGEKNVIPDGARAALALMTKSNNNNNKEEDQRTLETSHSATSTTATTITTDRQHQPILQLVCQRTEQDKIEVFQRRRTSAAAAAAVAVYASEAAALGAGSSVRKQIKPEVKHDGGGGGHDDVVFDSDFIRLLQILQIQWMTNTISSSAVAGDDQGKKEYDDDDTRRFWHISFDSSRDVFYDDMSTMKSIQRLFEEGLGLTLTSSSEDDGGEEIEWVEMMSSTNQKVAILPRTFIHKYNILHRGVGVFVTKDRPIKFFSSGSSSSSSSSESTFPDLYVHRRVSTKRIFPSLYDMFVGGVSVADEPSYITARREVGEELDLHGNGLFTDSVTSWSIHNHDDEANPMLRPEPLFTCLVCTAYNRCLVDLFQYTMSTEHESIKWQEEEVSWGDFVPYQEIVDAADLSMERFHTAKEWPGGQGYFPPLKSSPSSSSSSAANTKGGSNSVGSEHQSKSWDFVPDGLLVWRAWLEYLNNLS